VPNDFRFFSVGTIKAIIRFFRESPKRSLVPNIPLLCETRLTAKYKSIRVFTKKFDSVFEELSKLATVSFGKTCQEAHQLESASSTTTFLICMTIISVYPARLESVTQALQGIHINMWKVYEHINELLVIFNDHRLNAKLHFQQNFSKVKVLPEKIDVSLMLPRQCSRQKN